MNRRGVLRTISIATGAGVILPNFIGCYSSDYIPLFFNSNELQLVNIIAETILPKSYDAPGAAEAKVAQFIDLYVHDCSSIEEQNIIRNGLRKLNKTCESEYHQQFEKLDSNNQTKYLIQMDNVSKDVKYTHYFQLLKNLIVFGYFTSREGMEQALDYLPIPKKYVGNIPLEEQKKTWAL